MEAIKDDIDVAIKGIHANYLAMRGNLKEAKYELVLSLIYLVFSISLSYSLSLECSY